MPDAGDREQRLARLHDAAERRSQDSAARAQRAITRLDSRGEPVNFRRVAEAAKVSTSFLYKHEELRKRIQQLRGRETRRADPAPAAAERSLRTKLEATTRRLAALEEENRRLKEENAVLRGELVTSRRRPAASAGEGSSADS